MRHFKIILLWVFISAFSTNGYAEDSFGQRQANDGTYRIEKTASPEECAALCQSDNEHICRGHIFYQSDTRLPHGECRLNSGIGEHSIFKVEAPDDINPDRILSDINEYRAQYDLAPLTWNVKLADAAQVHASDLAYHGLIQHEGTDGSHHGERVRRQGYAYLTALENVAGGQRKWPEALQGWKNSKGHNEAMLSPEVSEFGVAVKFNPTTRFTTYWAMVLAEPFPTKN